MQTSAVNIDQGIQWKAVARDVVIVFILTAIGGFLIGLTGVARTNQAKYMLAIAAANFLMGIVAFTIAGSLAPAPRWRHLTIVVVASWVASLINVFVFEVPLLQWIFAIIPLFIMMGIGGSISCLFKRN
jgi:hypothetical protein